MLEPVLIDAYHRDGFIVVQERIPPALLAQLRAVTDELWEAARGLTSHTEVYDLEDSHLPERPRVRRIKRPFRVNPVFQALVRDPLMIEVVTSLLGPNVRHMSGILNFKAPEYGAPVEWHQDWVFYPHTNDDLLAVGIFLDDVTLENGPVLFVPGSQRGIVHDHHAEGRFCGAIDVATAGLDLAAAVPALGPAGSISVHHCRVVHGSALNASPHPRRVLYYEYIAADAFPILGLARQYSNDPDNAYEIYNSRIVAGEPSNWPRMEKIPVQLPLPAARHVGSIYENQKTLRCAHFEKYGQQAKIEV